MEIRGDHHKRRSHRLSSASTAPEHTAANDREYFDQRVDYSQFDYSSYYRLLGELNFPEDRISEDMLLGHLSGGEKIKFQLLCELLRRPTLLLLDEPSNDFDVQSVQWLEKFIQDSKIPVMFVSHDELLLERCANTIIHLEQLMRKRKPQHTIARLSYSEYVENRGERILRQTQLAKKEKEEFDKRWSATARSISGFTMSRRRCRRRTLQLPKT